MKKTVITGANGFVGRNLLKALPSAVAFDRHQHDFFKLKSLESLFTNTKAIVHLAGVNAGSSYAPSTASLIQNNLDVTNQLVQAINLFCNTKPRVVFLSSIHVYENSAKQIFETTEIAPNSLYGVIKYGQELILKQAAFLGLLDLVVFRSSNIYGPDSKPFYNSAIATMCFNALADSELELYGHGQACMDLVYISEVTEKIKKALELPNLAGVEIYNMASGNVVTVAEVANQIEKILNRQVKRKFIDSVVRHYMIDVSRLRQRFGETENTSLLKGLENQIQSMILNDQLILKKSA